MSTEASSQTSVPAIHGKYLTFLISREKYGIEILKVQEIIGVPNVTRVPGTVDCIKGVINLRGKIIPVLELRARFGIEPKPYDALTCIIVVRVQHEDQNIPVGIVVDTVLEVIDFSANDVEVVPDYGLSLDTSYIRGMGKKEKEGLHVLLDVEKVLNTSELASIAKV